jgi:hypothetical protein
MVTFSGELDVINEPLRRHSHDLELSVPRSEARTTEALLVGLSGQFLAGS